MFVFCFFFLFFFFVVDFVVCVVFAVVVAVVFDVIVFCCITFPNDTRPPSMGILAPQIPGQEGSAGAPKGLQCKKLTLQVYSLDISKQVI